MDDHTPDVFGIVGSTVAGAYEVTSVVAEGGFAVVYRALHTGFSAPVALKCLKLSQKLPAERQAAFLAQFRAEAELSFQLSASIPTVVRPLHVDAFTNQDGTFVPFMVLEWLDGETLDSLVRRRRESGRAPLALKKLVRLLTPVARALERGHNFRGPRGTVSVVHRDLKPENIFIAEVAGEQVVKLLDFGVARAQSVASQVAGQSGEATGGGSFTPAYAAPEQWLPKRYGQTGPWTDVWGLALTLVEALKGDTVLGGDVQSMMTQALDKQRRPTPRNHGVDVSDAVETVFARALALDPRERPADAGVFWDELLAALGMKIEDRYRDTRTEAGMVPREERIEAALSSRPRGTAQAAADMRASPRLDPDSSMRVPVARIALARQSEESSSRMRVAPRVEPDSSSGVTRAARVESVPGADSSARLRAAPRFGAEMDDPFTTAAAPRIPTPTPQTAERGEEPAGRLEIDVQAPARDEPRRLQTGRHVPHVPAPAARSAPGIWPRLALGAGLIVAAIALTLADRQLAASGGLPLGPVSPLLVAGVLILGGIAVIAHQLLRERA